MNPDTRQRPPASYRRCDSTGRLSACVSIIAAFAFAPRTAVADDAPARELFEALCFRCHGNGQAKGEFALDELLDAKGVQPDRAKWEKVWKTVRHGFMPPPDADQPTDPERRDIARWIERTAYRADPAKPDPGRVTVRRLNRTEYTYTVRDLFGIDGDWAKDLPPDDTAFGFDNIGDAQTLSPTLLETYLNQAEAIVAAAVVVTPRHPRIALNRGDFKALPRDADAKRGAQSARVEVKHDGRYEAVIEFKLGGWQEFGGEFRFDATLGNQPVVRGETVKNGGDKVYRFMQEVELTAGPHDLLLFNESTDAQFKPLTLNPQVTVTGPLGTDIYEYPDSHRRVFFRGPAPDDAAARKDYAREILRRVADRAFRRPADEPALDRLVEIAVGGGENFEAGVARALTAILSSPRFYYRTELQPRPDDPTAVHPLDDFALASRLSYLLWLSIPDAELTDLAARERLRDELDRQVARMLADPKSKRFFEDFAGQWLRTRNIMLAPVDRRFEIAVDSVRPLLKRETEMLFEHIAREDRDLTELLTADYSFLNQRLAEYYGIKGVKGDEMKRVPLPPDSHRGGVLTHASILISTSNPNRTSPVKRGLFVLENLLGKEIPPPPPNVGELEDQTAEAGGRRLPFREQLAAHRSQASCAACHNHFDPVGLALEQFDGTGRWREKDGGEPIDPRATLATGEEISGIGELSRALAAHKDVFYRCVTEKLLTYALGRGLEPTDAVVVDRIADRVAADGGKFSTLLAGVIHSEPFLTRRGDSGESGVNPIRTPAVPQKPKVLPMRPQRPPQDRDRRKP